MPHCEISRLASTEKASVPAMVERGTNSIFRLTPRIISFRFLFDPMLMPTWKISTDKMVMGRLLLNQCWGMKWHIPATPPKAKSKRTITLLFIVTSFLEYKPIGQVGCQQAADHAKQGKDECLVAIFT